MDETFINNIYKKAFSYFSKFLGHDTTNTGQLEGLGQAVFGRRFVGVLPADVFVKMLPSMKPGDVGIMNNQQSHELGEHWLAFGITKDGTPMIHDTFGRNLYKLIPAIKGIKVIEPDKDKEQRSSENSCGVHALSMNFVFDQFGEGYARMI